MSQFRVEKRRVEAELTLSSGHSVRGIFFLAGSCSRHAGPERVADLLNAQDGFFPFETASDRAGMLLVNRAHVIAVRLLEQPHEPELDPGYAVAPERRVMMRPSNGTTPLLPTRLPAGRVSGRICSWIARAAAPCAA